MTLKIKVIQANLQFSKAATHETLNYIEKHQISIALLQEPYCYKSNNIYKIPASGAFKVISVNNERFFSAIVINNKLLETLALVHLCTKYVSAVNITIGDRLIDLVSVYFPPAVDFGDCLNSLQISVDYCVRNYGLLLAGDFNCRSTIWFDDNNDVNSVNMEEFILRNNLAVHNEPDLPPTFETVNGCSNIDLTMSSFSLISNLVDWTVVRGINTADHNVILFTLKFDNFDCSSKNNVTYIYNTAQINYDNINAKIPEVIDSINLTTEVLDSQYGIDNALTSFYDGLKALVIGAAKKKCFSERPPWWNDKIDRFRKIYLKKKKLLYDNRFPENRTYLYDSMMDAKNRFKAVIEQEKSKSWSKFVKDDLAANPWGTVYKLASQKFRQQGAVSSLRNNDTYTGTVLETAEFIVNSLLPDDNLNDDNLNDLNE